MGEKLKPPVLNSDVSIVLDNYGRRSKSKGKSPKNKGAKKNKV